MAEPQTNKESVADILQTLQDVSGFAAVASPDPAILNQMLTKVSQGIGAERLAVYRLSADGVTLEMAAICGKGTQPLPPTLAADEAGDPGFGPVQLGAITDLGDIVVGVGSALPLFSGGHPFGLLWAERAAGSENFSEVALSGLSVFANQLANLFELADLMEEARANKLERESIQKISRQMTLAADAKVLMDMVLESGMRITGASGGVLYLSDRTGELLKLAAKAGDVGGHLKDELPMGYGIPGWVAQKGRPIRVSEKGTGPEDRPDASRRNQLAVPLVSEGDSIGVLALEGGGAEDFTPTHEEILTIFAAQAAKAIEAARLFQAIRDERDLRESILSGTPNGVVALDGAGVVVMMNQSARRLLEVEGYPEGERIGRYLPQTEFAEALWRIQQSEGEGLESLELTVGPVDSERIYLLSLFPLVRSDRRGATLIIQDLTERKRLDEHVQRLGRIASLGQLAAGIAHEIRNPLTGIGITLDILAEERGMTDEGRAQLADIGREIDRLELLVRGVLDFARPQPMEVKPVRLAETLVWHRSFREQCKKKGVEFVLDRQTDAYIRGDSEKLKQLFLNLAINALEATEAGGSIELAARVELRDNGVYEAVVTISDTGCGMDGETAAQVFNPFFTTKNEGTGLGLSIAHSIAEQHSGMIDIVSAPGKGTVFTVRLPAMEE